MQDQRLSSAFQRNKHTEDTTSQPQGEGPKTHKSGIIYHYKCPHISCPEAYIGESGRALGERVKEHLKFPSPIFHHSAATGHPLDSDNFNTIHKDVHSHSKTTKEAMFISVNDPTLNRNLGKYQLLHIWDSILQASSMLQLKPSSLSTSPDPPLTPLYPLNQFILNINA